MADLKFLSENEPRNMLAEWTIRAGVAAFFIIFGLEKFSEDPASHWVRLFHEIGRGDWFRYATGAIEVLGGLLVLVPRAALFGLILLALTMAGAAIIVAFVLGHLAESAFPGFFLLLLIGVIVWERQGASARRYR